MTDWLLSASDPKVYHSPSGQWNPNSVWQAINNGDQLWAIRFTLNRITAVPEEAVNTLIASQ